MAKLTQAEWWRQLEIEVRRTPNDKGETTHPCQACGGVHHGQYGVYAWGHCNCPHEDERWTGDFHGYAYVLCAACGEDLSPEGGD